MIETYRIKMMIDTTLEMEVDPDDDYEDNSDFVFEQFFESYNVEYIIDHSTIEIVRCD